MKRANSTNRTATHSNALERANKDKESLEKRVKEVAAKWEESKEALEEAEERLEEMEKRLEAAKEVEKEKDERHDKLMKKLKELEKKNFDLLETARMAETHRQAD